MHDAVEKAMALGARVVTVSDSSGTVLDEQGFSPAKLADGYLAKLRKAGFNPLDQGWSVVNTKPLSLMMASSLGRF